MNSSNSKPSWSSLLQHDGDSGDSGLASFGLGGGGWNDLDTFSLGRFHGPQVLADSGTAASNVDFELQAVTPGDYASIRITLGDVVNLDAWANAGAVGSVSANVTAQGLATFNGGKLSGSYTACLTIDATAWIPADQVTMHLHITDSFQFGLSGSGYAGATVTVTSLANSNVVATSPGSTTAAPGCGDGGTFDLARFAASVLNTGQAQVSFVASTAGESLHGIGTSLVTLTATADVAGIPPGTISYHDVDHHALVFNAVSGGHAWPGAAPFVPVLVVGNS